MYLSVSLSIHAIYLHEILKKLPFEKHILISICNYDTAISGFSSEGNVSLGKIAFSQLCLPSLMLKARLLCNLESQSEFYQIIICFPAPRSVRLLWFCVWTCLRFTAGIWWKTTTYLHLAKKKWSLDLRYERPELGKSHILSSSVWDVTQTELHLCSQASAVCLLLWKKDLHK